MLGFIRIFHEYEVQLKKNPFCASLFASRGLPNDAEHWSLGTDFSVCRNTFELPHDKTNKMFAVCSVGSWGPNVSWCQQRWLWSDWADAQADLSFAVLTGDFVGFVMRQLIFFFLHTHFNKWAPSSEFVSSSIPSWQILTAHAQPFRRARDLAFCLKVPLDSLLVWASSGGSGETARMRRLAWTFAARIGDKYQIRLTRSKY